MLARKPLTIVAFLPPGAHYVRQCEKNLPDWWSVLSFRTELDFPESAKTTLGEYPAYYSSLNRWPAPRSRYRANKLISRLHEEGTELSESVKVELLARLFEALISGGFFAEGESFFRDYLTKVREGSELYYRLLVYLARFKHQLGEFRQEAALLEKVLEAGRRLDRLIPFTVEDVKILLPDDLWGTDISTIQYPEYPDDYISEANRKRAEIWFELGDFQRAAGILQEERKRIRPIFGKKHPIMASVGAFLGLIYLQLGHLKKAEKLFSEALHTDISSFGKAHPVVATDMFNLGVTCLQTGDKDKATDLLSSAFKLYSTSFGKPHPKTKKAKSWLEKARSPK